MPRRFKKPRLYCLKLTLKLYSVSAKGYVDRVVSKMLGVAFTHAEAQKFRDESRTYEGWAKRSYNHLIEVKLVSEELDAHGLEKPVAQQGVVAPRP
jgi:hypothetical protein